MVIRESAYETKEKRPKTCKAQKEQVESNFDCAPHIGRTLYLRRAHGGAGQAPGHAPQRLRVRAGENPAPGLRTGAQTGTGIHTSPGPGPHARPRWHKLYAEHQHT